jgi:hypothetical protein
LLIQLLNTGFVPKRDERCPGTRISSSSGLWFGIRFAEQGAMKVTARVTLTVTVTAVNNGCVSIIKKTPRPMARTKSEKNCSLENSKNPKSILIKK